MYMLQETIVYVRKGEKLSEAFKRKGYDTIPPNCVINKAIPGLGITHCELTSDRNSILIEPNRAVIRNKTEKYKNVMGVYDGISSREIADYLSKPSPSRKKIMITSDDFLTVKEIMEELNTDVYEEFFLLYDEYNREYPVENMREEFYRFRNRSLVSPAPVILADPLLEKHGFYILNIQPEYEYMHPLNLVTTNNVAETLSSRIARTDAPVCIFCNSAEAIESLLNDIPLLREEGCVFRDGEPLSQPHAGGEHQKETYVSRLRRCNLFTSHYYLGVDIELPEPPHVILISDLFGKKPSFIDPGTETAQIVGRFRRGVKSITHISNIDAELNFYTPKQVRTWLKNAGKIYASWVRKMEKTQQEGARELLKEVIQHSSYARFVDRSGHLNMFAVARFIEQETVKGLYTQTKLLKEAYLDTKLFDVSHSREMHIFSDKDRLLLNCKLTQEGRNRVLLTHFEQLEVLRKVRTSKAQMRYRQLVERLINNPSDNFLYNCFIKYGSGFIRDSGYRENVMRTEMNK
jgi:hypothetical protein